jgi:hypothetical protein
MTAKYYGIETGYEGQIESEYQKFKAAIAAEDELMGRWYAWNMSILMEKASKVELAIVQGKL